MIRGETICGANGRRPARAPRLPGNHIDAGGAKLKIHLTATFLQNADRRGRRADVQREAAGDRPTLACACGRDSPLT